MVKGRSTYLKPVRHSERQTQRAAQKCCEWRHLAAGGGERRHKFRAADLRVGELHGSPQIAQLEVVDELVVGRKASGRTRESAGIIPIKQLANLAPLVAARHNR